MSAFSEAMTSSFAVSQTVFGDDCTIGDYPATCVVHSLGGTNAVAGDRPGRQESVTGQIVVSKSDWETAGGKKGTVITVNGAQVRVVNDPIYGPDSLEVVLTVEQRG